MATLFAFPFRTNNLENFKPRKIVITSRCEPFAGQLKEKYHELFYPIEANNIDKDEKHEALEYISEWVSFFFFFFQIYEQFSTLNFFS